MVVSKALALVAGRNFRPFDSNDYDSFAGVDAPNPLISYPDEIGQKYIVIIAGTIVSFIDSDGDEYRCELSYERI